MIKRTFFILPLLFGLVLWLACAQAEPVKGLYQATVSVVDKSPTAREKAIEQAMKIVLIKVSGNPGIATLPAIQTGLQNSKQYLSEYNYLAPSDDNEQRLQVSFSGDAIQQLLLGSGQSIWSANRPTVLVWLSVDNDVDGTIVGSDDNNPLASVLSQQSNNSGVPITLPLMDLQDLQAVSSQQLNVANLGDLLRASQRYNTEDVLVIHLQQTSAQQWQANTLFIIAQQPIQRQYIGSDPQQVFQQIMANMAIMLAARQGQFSSASKQHQLRLSISNVSNLDDYVRITDYLRSLSAVKNVEVQSLEGSEVLLSVQLQTDEQNFVEVLNKSLLLKPSENNLLDSSGLNYQFVA